MLSFTNIICKRQHVFESATWAKALMYGSKQCVDKNMGVLIENVWEQNKLSGVYSVIWVTESTTQWNWSLSKTPDQVCPAPSHVPKSKSKMKLTVMGHIFLSNPVQPKLVRHSVQKPAQVQHSISELKHWVCMTVSHSWLFAYPCTYSNRTGVQSRQQTTILIQ